jgi:hypothetical protein
VNHDDDRDDDHDDDHHRRVRMDDGIQEQLKDPVSLNDISKANI